MRFNRLVILSLLIACKATSTSTSTGSYSEDLSIHRPVSSIELAEKEQPDTSDEVVQEKFQELNGHIKAEMDSIAKIAYLENTTKRYVDGFVIQVYSGNSREDAYASRSKMYELFPELAPKLSYHQPSFRVKAGRFVDRLEAHRVYREVKQEFPRALLIPERFLATYE